MKLTHCCLHLAIYLLDIFMDNHSIVPERLLLVANSCILIAGIIIITLKKISSRFIATISAKFEEISTAIPKIKDLNDEIGNVHSINDCKTFECIILKFYNWYVMFPTVAHYVSYFLRAVISEDEFKRITNPRTVLYEMHLVIWLLMEKSIDGNFNLKKKKIHCIHSKQFCFRCSLHATVFAIEIRCGDHLCS